MITIFVVAVQLSAAIAEPPAILGSVDWSQLSVTSGGQIRFGISSSTIVIVCSQVVALPHSSTAVHTRTIAPAVPLQAAKAPPFWSTNVSVILPAALQLSVAVA